MWNADKYAHFITAIATVLVCVVVCIWEPSLVKDPATKLGTIGFFATAYGVLFAIVELRRAKAASNLAKEKSEEVQRALTNLVTAREITECQSTIVMAITSLEEDTQVHSVLILQIVKLYSQVFHEELQNAQSEHRKNRSMIEAYVSVSAPKTDVRKKSIRTRSALIAIAAQLGELQGATKNFTEYTK